MTLRSDLRSEIQTRLGDPAGVVFVTTEVNSYIDKAVKSLYPTYWRYQVSTTTAGNGPIQTAPAGARDIYYIGVQRVGSTRVRLMRQWREGNGEAFVPKTGINGETLVWAWTAGFTAPTDDSTPLDLTPETEEVVVLRCMISCLERILTTRAEKEKYFALTVREGVTEQDIATTLDALHGSLQQRLQQAVKRPDRQG